MAADKLLAELDRNKKLRAEAERLRLENERLKRELEMAALMKGVGRGRLH